MARNLEQILRDVNSTLDLENALPTGDELNTRQNYADQAVWDASATGQLSEFKKEFVSTATMATISLPADFREAQENPRLLDSNGSWREYKLRELEEKYETHSNEDWAYIGGNPSEGYKLIFNSLLTNATLSFIYQRYPSGLLTLSDVCELSDPQFVVRKVESYILYSRSDERLQVAEQRAAALLQNMMGREMKGTTGNSRDTKSKFRSPLGRMA